MRDIDQIKALLGVLIFFQGIIICFLSAVVA